MSDDRTHGDHSAVNDGEGSGNNVALPHVFKHDKHGQLARDLLRAIADPGQYPVEGNMKGNRSVSEWSRDAVVQVLQRAGWVLPGVPPVEQVLADGRQFSDELVLTKLVARFFRLMILGRVVLPETPAAMDWLRDYIDGTHRVHGPLGKPMIWPERLVTTCQLLREWGFQPTPTQPAYVSLKPGAKMLDIEMPEPQAPDPRSVEPISPRTELRMGSLLDSFTQGVSCMAVDRATVLRAMEAAAKQASIEAFQMGYMACCEDTGPAGVVPDSETAKGYASDAANKLFGGEVAK